MESSKLNTKNVIDTLMKLYQHQEKIKLKYKIVENEKSCDPCKNAT